MGEFISRIISRVFWRSVEPYIPSPIKELLFVLVFVVLLIYFVVWIASFFMKNKGEKDK